MIPTEIHYIWVALAVVWAVSAGPAASKTTAWRQSTESRLTTVALAVAGFTLLLWPLSHLGVLAGRLTVDTPLTRGAALGLTAGGAALAAWARITLGRNWSAAATIKDEHDLVAKGPYRFVRHPIYAGGIVAAFGTALSVGDAGGYAGVALITVAWLLKMRVEETMLVTAFGERYVAYTREVSALIPFLL